MDETPTTNNRRSNALRLFAQPETFAELVGAIAEGESLAQWCKRHDVPYQMTVHWITSDEARTREYTAALELRRQHTADTVIYELQRMAGTDISLVFNEDGSPRLIHQIPEDVRRCISSVEVVEVFEGAGAERQHVGRLHKFRLWDKGQALERLGRHLKLFTDKVEVDAAPELAEALAKARARRAAAKDQDHA